MSRTLSGRYQLADFLGDGGTGDVWSAVDRVTGRPVAVKVLRPSLAADSWLVGRLLQARDALGALWHPSIVPLLDVVVDGTDGTALVTDLVDGTDLRTWLATRGPMAPAQGAEVVATVAEALEAAHRSGMAHGDVKPSNVLVPPPYGGQIRLTDFAIAVLVDGGSVATAEGDVYALGLLLRDLVPGSPTLRAIANVCTAHDPAARPTAGDVADRLWKVIPALASPALPPKFDAGRAVRRRRVAWVVAAVATAAVLVAGGIVGARALRAPAADSPSDVFSGPASSSSGAPELPLGATSRDQPGAREFVEFWFTALTYAQQTGDTDPVSAVTSPSCTQCQAAFETIRAAYASGGSLRGGIYVVRSVAVNDLLNLERPVYEATVDRSARSTVDRNGSLLDTLPALSFSNCIMVLEWNNGWRVFEVTSRGCVA